MIWTPHTWQAALQCVKLLVTVLDSKRKCEGVQNELQTNGH
jgi:hypothetical protein